MKFSCKLIIPVLTMLVLAASAHAQSPREQLNQLVTQLQSNPSDTTLREKIVKLAQTIKPPLAVPEEARRKFVEGTTITKSANNASGQALAVQRFQDSLKIAPWWGDAYYNLAIAQELAGQFEAAQSSLKLYIVTNPGEKESRDAQDRIYALNAKKDLAKVEAANAVAQAAAKEQADGLALLTSLDGAAFEYRQVSGGTLVTVYSVNVRNGIANLRLQDMLDRSSTPMTGSCQLTSAGCNLSADLNPGWTWSLSFSADGRNVAFRTFQGGKQTEEIRLARIR